MTDDRVDPLRLRDAAIWVSEFAGTPTLLDFVGQRVGLAGTLAVVRLLRPELVEIEGCVLLQERFDPHGFREWWQRLDGNVPAIESVMNHIHLWDVFESADDDQLAEAALRNLTFEIAASWRCLLRETYPDRDFEVEASTGEEGLDYGPTVSFASVEGPT